MGIAVGLIISAVGLILALAVHPTGSHPVNVNTVGWIMFVLGLVAMLLDLMLWSSWGPGYLRRTAYVEGAAPVRRRGYPARRRTVVEEVDEPAPGPPPGY
jgi:hypothetical protein